MPVSDRTMVARYARVAPRYDRLHDRWLRYAGGEAQSAFEGAVTALIKPGMAVLDVGCGTGALARRLARQFGATIAFTLVDACPQMLDRAADIGVTRAIGSIEKLPVRTAAFDLVTCSWALETTPHTEKALAELLRAVKPGGQVCIAFCADLPCMGLRGFVLKCAIRWRRTGRFLPLRDVEDGLSRLDVETVLRLPCRGPAAALLIQKPASSTCRASSNDDASASGWSGPAAAAVPA